jgi:competence protein ComEC
MKTPAVAIAAAFAGGIVLGQCQPLAQRVSSHLYLTVDFVGTAVLICAAIFLVRLRSSLPAAALSLLSWLNLGLLGAGVAHQPRLGDHVLSLVERQSLDLGTPLRWHGYLRDEPARLPWGYGYELELTEVEYDGSPLKTRGGLRVSFSPPEGQGDVPEVHAGDEIAVVTQAKRPEVFRDDGAFDRRAYLEQQNIHLIATLRASDLMERISSAKPTFGVWLARARRRLREEIDSLFAKTPQVAGVLRAMLLGDRSFVDRTEATDFQKTGVFHVLVVAGLHVGALAAFLFWMGRRLRLAPSWTALSTLALLFVYIAVVEQRPPVLRAALMTSIVVLGGWFFRRLDLVNSAGVAALLLLIAKPLAVRDSSFQLTFLAIGCIAGLAVPWLDKTAQPYVKALRGWRDITRDAAHEPRAVQFRIDLRAIANWISARLPSRLATSAGDSLVRAIGFSLRVWELLVITLALQMGMLPLMARDFHRITLDAPLVNLAAVPLTGLIVPFGFLTLATALVLPTLGKLLAAPLAWMTLLLLRTVQWFAHIPRWSYRIPGPPEWLVLILLAAALFLAATFRTTLLQQKWVVRTAGGILLASAILIATFPFSPRWAKGKLELTVLDVGQGDSLFLVSPRGKTLLIDGGGSFQGFAGRQEYNGPDPGEEAVSPYLWSRGFQKLDVVMLTHAHQDHIGGLFAILDNFHVGRLWIGREVSSVALANLERLALEKKIPVVHEVRGKEFSWDGVDAQFFWPEIPPEEVGPSAKNNDSLVLRVRYGERGVMLPGDAEKQAESTILSENGGETLRSDVLKVGHHGSKNSTTPEFLAAVHPRVAVISAGEDNPYGHPSPELLERLEAAGVWTLRTDRDGAVHVLTDGKRLEIACFVSCSEPTVSEASRQTQPPAQQQHSQQ